MPRVGFIIFFGFFVRLLYAGWIEYSGIERALDSDALAFYSDIVAYDRMGQFMDFEVVGRNPYINLSLIFARFFGTSAFAICLFSILCWTAAAWLFGKMLDDLNAPGRTRMVLMVLFCLWPTAIPYTSIPLRESMQLLGMTLLVFACVRSLLHRSAGYGIFALLGVIIAGSTHGSLLMAGFVIIALYLVLFSVFGREKISVTILSINAGIGIGFVVVGFGIFSALAYDLSDGLLETIAQYQEGGLSLVSRADYRDTISAGSLAQSLIGIPVGFVQYLFEPFPGRSFAFIDLVLTAENMIRGLFILIAIRAMLAAGEVHGKLLAFFVFGAYIITELIWSVGTINWGTASRHHVPAMAMLLLPAAMINYRWRPVRRHVELAIQPAGQ